MSFNLRFLNKRKNLRKYRVCQTEFFLGFENEVVKCSETQLKDAHISARQSPNKDTTVLMDSSIWSNNVIQSGSLRHKCGIMDGCNTLGGLSSSSLLTKSGESGQI